MPRGRTLLGRHLPPDLAEVGTVGADTVGQFGGRAGLGNQKFEVIQSDFFGDARHAGNYSRNLAQR